MHLAFNLLLFSTIRSTSRNIRCGANVFLVFFRSHGLSPSWSFLGLLLLLCSRHFSSDFPENLIEPEYVETMKEDPHSQRDWECVWIDTALIELVSTMFIHFQHESKPNIWCHDDSANEKSQSKQQLHHDGHGRAQKVRSAKAQKDGRHFH